MEQQQHGLLQMRESYSSSCRSRTGITSRGSSEFEFQFSEQVLYDEPPLSPKLATALSNYACFHINSESATSKSDGNISQRKINILEPVAIINDSDRTSAATVVINAASDEMAISNIRVPLRSLIMLDRRELEQLPPLFNKIGAHVMNDQLLHPSDSDIIIKDNIAEDHDDDDAPSSSTSSASSPDQLFRSDQKKKIKKVEQLKKKSRIRHIWSFINLDFLKKARSVNAVAHKYRLQQLLSINHELGWRADHSSVRSGANHTKRGGYILAHRHNNHNIFDGKEESMNAIQHSTPVRPAASPSLHHSLYSHAIYLRGSLDQAAAAATPTTFNYVRPSSPHAEHYRQQRARAEEVRRKTSLPYRQPLLMLGGASCFQPQVW